MITPEDIQFLDDNRTHYDTLIKAFYLRGLSGETRSRMQEIIGKYWQPGYHTDLWCGPCVSEMVKKLYRHYDEWLKEQPVTVQANFPSNKDDENS
jgi:hypothetical protein